MVSKGRSNTTLRDEHPARIILGLCVALLLLAGPPSVEPYPPDGIVSEDPKVPGFRIYYEDETFEDCADYGPDACTVLVQLASPRVFATYAECEAWAEAHSMTTTSLWHGTIVQENFECADKKPANIDGD